MNSRFNPSLICWRSRLGEVFDYSHIFGGPDLKVIKKKKTQCLFRSWRAWWGGAIFPGPRTTSSGEENNYFVQDFAMCKSQRLILMSLIRLTTIQNLHSNFQYFGTRYPSTIIIIFSGGMEFRGTRPISLRWFLGLKSSSPQVWCLMLSIIHII